MIQFWTTYGAVSRQYNYYLNLFGVYQNATKNVQVKIE